MSPEGRRKIFIIIQFLLFIIAITCIFVFFNTQQNEEQKIEEVAVNTWIKYSYLNRSEVKFAIYNLKAGIFVIYSINKLGEIKEVGSEQHDPKQFIYDTISETFKEISTHINISIDGDLLKVTNDTREVIIKLNGMVYDINNKKLCNKCKPGPCTISQYLEWLGVENKTYDSTIVPNLYIECIDDVARVSSCPNDTIFDGENCIEPIAKQKGFIVKRIPYTENKFKVLYKDRVEIVNCVNGVDSTLISCNDVQCIKRNGINGDRRYYLDNVHGFIGSFYKCNDGHVIDEANCSLKQISKNVMVLGQIYTITYPEEVIEKLSGELMCTNTTLGHLKSITATHIRETFKNYVALAKTASFKYMKGSAIPYFISRPPRIGTYPLLGKNDEVMKNGKQVKIGKELVVFNNRIYTMIDDDITLPTTNTRRGFTTSYFTINDHTIYAYVGVNILSFATVDVQDRKMEIRNSLSIYIKDDFEHLPSVFHLYKLKKNFYIKYKSTSELYGINTTEKMEPEELIDYYKKLNNQFFTDDFITEFINDLFQ